MKGNNVMEKFSEFVIRRRWAIIVIFLCLTIFMGIQIKDARFNSDLLTYLPDDMPARVHQKQVEEIFGGTDMVMLVLKTDDVINKKTLKRVKTFSRAMKKIKGIEKVMSLFELKQVRSEDDAMLVDPAVKMIPRTQEDIKTIKKEIIENDMVYGSVVSKDFTSTAIIGMLEPGASDKAVVGELEDLIRDTPGEEEVLLGGSPYMRVQNGLSMQKDISRLLPLGMLLMLLFLLVSFRQARGVWLPAVVVLMSVFISLGLIPLLKWDFTVVTILLPVLLIAVANDYGIHMFAHYQDDNFPGNSFSKEVISRRMITTIGMPVILAGITTMAGLLCMMGHIIIPAWQMGVLGTVGIGVALLASLFFIPAVSSVLPKTRPVLTPANNEKGKKGMNRVLTLISDLVTKRPRTVLITLLVITVIISTGIFRLSVNTNPAKLFPAGHPAKVSAELINRKLGGFFPLSIVFEGDIKDPVLLKRIDQTEKKIRKIPEVGVTQSIAKVTRQISRALNNKGEEGYDKIPDTYNAVSQYFELYLMSGDPDDLEKMVDFSFQKAMILVRFKELNTPILRKCVREIKEMVKDDPAVKLLGGNADVFSEMDKKVVHGQFLSLGMSLLAVFIIIYAGLRFRSIKGAVMQTIPLLMAILILFGLMGFAGIELNFMTALLSSIMIGVGVDYTIHMVWRYRDERRKGSDPAEAIQHTIHSTGRGIIYNAFSVIIGFAALIFSSFLSVRFFGLLMVIIVFCCLVGGLVFVPALCMAVRPRFLEPLNKNIGYKKEN